MTLRPFVLYPDSDRIRRVVVENARGRVYHENGEPLRQEPDGVAFLPWEQLNPEQRDAFEANDTGLDFAARPEVGSRMTVHLLDAGVMVGGWITVEAGRYRHCVDWFGDVKVKTVIWEYLATEARWTGKAA